MGTPFQVVFDCTDPDRMAHFWADVLKYKLQDPPEGHATWEDFLRAMNIPEEKWNSASAVVDPEGKGPRLYFQQVPEAKTTKNRVHIDVNVTEPRETALEERRRRVNAEVERVVGLGATRLRVGDEDGGYWVVMADIEGNEFCLH